MASPREIIEAARSEEFFDHEGKRLVLTVLPGLDPEALRKYEAALGAPLPPEIDDLLHYTRGIEFEPDDGLVFDGGFSFGMEKILPRAVPLGQDGCGNDWLVEVQPSGAWGPVFFACHDAPVLVVVAKDVATFIDEYLSVVGRPDSESTVTHEDAMDHICDEEPWGQRAGSLYDDPDETLRTFAQSLSPDDVVFDLREQTVGSGLYWGKHEPDFAMRRCGDALIFARLTPPPKPGFFKRLFGG